MILPINTLYLPEVIDLHYRILSWSTNAQLGKEHIEELYHAIFKLPSTFGFIYKAQAHTIGFITGSLNAEELRQAIASAINFNKKMKILLNAFKRPLDLIDIFECAVLIPHFLRNRGIMAEISTWVTDKDYPNAPFAAVECMNAAREYFRKRGVSHCVAQVLVNNTAPNQYYIRMGSKLIKSFYQNKIYMINCNN